MQASRLSQKTLGDQRSSLFWQSVSDEETTFYVVGTRQVAHEHVTAAETALAERAVLKAETEP